MDIKELDKKQLILLTLLITFVVSIATGIVTVSLMNQAPKSVPQTINNVIQRTIEKVTTVEAPAVSPTSSSENKKDSNNILLGGGDTLVPIYSVDSKVSDVPITTIDGTENIPSSSKELGQGVIMSDVGLILVDSSILNDSQVYKVILDKTDFDATVLKKFNNGFAILKISEKKVTSETPAKTDTTKVIQ